LEYDDVVYGSSTIVRYLEKFHGVFVSELELNDRLSTVIEEEIIEEEVRHGVSG
jgi:hypothetical protein